MIWKCNLIKPELVELALYAAWFPLFQGWKKEIGEGFMAGRELRGFLFLRSRLPPGDSLPASLVAAKGEARLAQRSHLLCDQGFL